MFLVAVPAACHAASLPDPIDRAALPTALGAHSVMMATASAGSRLVAVGERGIILLSDDVGVHWRQAQVPVSVSLTGVQFVNDRQGWAIGHGGIVLHSGDGGENWVRQLDGRQAAALALQEAQARPAPGGNPDPLVANATQLVADGPDKPFLDLLFADAAHGLVVGAYGLIFSTEDGGRHWQSWIGHVENPQGLNIYAVAEAGTHIYLAGEQGFFARSDDAGGHFALHPTPHPASYFAMAAYAPGTVLLAGLRGSGFRSTDAGDSWQKLAVATDHSFTAMTKGGGALLLADDIGEIWVTRDEGAAFTTLPVSPQRPVTALRPANASTLLCAGPLGIDLAAIPAGAVSP